MLRVRVVAAILVVSCAVGRIRALIVGGVAGVGDRGDAVAAAASVAHSIRHDARRTVSAVAAVGIRAAIATRQALVRDNVTAAAAAITYSAPAVRVGRTIIIRADRLTVIAVLATAPVLACSAVRVLRTSNARATGAACHIQQRRGAALARARLRGGSMRLGDRGAAAGAALHEGASAGLRVRRATRAADRTRPAARGRFVRLTAATDAK